ncbi:MAG: aminotransferase class IV [Pirellulales bacterium]|nr:aminotransferase class IV [Pirellulales bacterium]
MPLPAMIHQRVLPDMNNPKVFLNGRMVSASEAHLNIFDLGVVQAATVTEMARTFHHRPYRLADHLARLAHSLEHAGFDPGMTIDELSSAVEEMVEHNATLIRPEDELSIAIFITAGESPIYAGGSGMTARTTPTVCSHTFPLPFDRWAEQMARGARVVTPSIRQIPSRCLPADMKCRSRMHYYLAEQEARRVDPDAVPLLLDLEGNVAETTTANFLIVERGTIVSPRLDGILPGISRKTIVELAGKLGIAFQEADLSVTRATDADEALLASTPFCLMPVTRINDATVGDGQPGPVFRRLIEAWSEQVGLDIVGQITQRSTSTSRQDA